MERRRSEAAGAAALLLLALVLSGCAPATGRSVASQASELGDGPVGVRTEGGRIEMATENLLWVVGSDGHNVAFQDRHTGRDYLAADAAAPFMAVQKDGTWHGATAARLLQGFLWVEFGDVGIRAKVHVRALPQYLVLELTAIDDHQIDGVRLVRLPLTLTESVSVSLTSCRNGDFGAALIPLNIETNSYPTRQDPVLLTAEADARVRLEGTRVAVLGSPTAELLDHIERIEIDNGLPHSTLDGVWARRSSEQMRSYLFVDLSEDTAEAMIDYAKAGGFGYIVVYDGVWNAAHGSYPVNTTNFPGGASSLKGVSDRIHAAGLKFGMHNLDMVVDKSDPLVHPVPDEGFMMYPDRRRVLAAPLGLQDTFLPTTQSPEGLLSKADKSRYHGRDLRIGDEIITYDELQTTPPFGFVGCTRGAHGTVAATHAAGAAIDNFSEFIGYYRPDVKSPLYDRIARAEAAALDRYEFDYIYPDGIGENLGHWPEGPRWYISNLLVSKLYHYTQREVMFAHGPVSNYSWHVFSRGNTVDYALTGMMKHFDATSLTNAANCIADLQPFEFGWYGYFTHSLAGDATRPREMEYAWSKALAHGAAMSLETGKAALDANGRTREIFARIRDWEELKLSGYFPERIRAQLQEKGREFALERDGDDAWRVRPVTYSAPHRVDGEASWTWTSPDEAQPLRAQIQVRPRLAAHGDTANIVLLEPPGPLQLYTEGSGPLGSPSRQTEGFDYVIAPSDHAPPTGGTSFEVRAANRGAAPSGWGCAEILLDEMQNLHQHRALGTWIEGDGSGAYLHFVIEDAGRWSVRDYYVRLDWTGWKYVQMSEWARGEVYDFVYPYNNYWAIRGINFGAIGRVYVFITHLAPGAATTVRFGRLEALRETPLPMRHPALRVGGQTLTFPVTIPAEGYLEYEGSGTARVFDANGFTQAQVAPRGDTPSLLAGANEVGFAAQAGEGLGQSATVTLITRGQPLE